MLGDKAHAYCYAQRTADGRIAMVVAASPTDTARARTSTGETARKRRWVLTGLLTGCSRPSVRARVDARLVWRPRCTA